MKHLFDDQINDDLEISVYGYDDDMYTTIDIKDKDGVLIKGYTIQTGNFNTPQKRDT